MSRIRKINFIKANNYNNDKYFNENECKQTSNELNGNQIKEIYENIISTNDPINDEIKQNLRNNDKNYNKTNNRLSDKRIETHKSLTNNIKMNSIFKYCQSGEFDNSLQWIRMGFDINIRDQYLWTPLMCSSCEGHLNIVNLLLKCGADPSAQDKKGRNAIDLALINGHKDVIELIIKHKKYKKLRNNTKNSNTNKKEELKSEQKKCDLCGHEFSTSEEKHICSISHQFNSITTKSTTFYQICEQNKGFQMMLKNGWSKELGLGPEGYGRKFPIKTVLKRDRLGLGIDKTKPKVTHFGSFDVKAVNNDKLNSDDKQSRKTKLIESKKLENKLKRIEIKFRQDFK
jgi:hypothetical protein